MERIYYKGFYIDATKTGYRISREDDISKHTHIRNLKASYRLINDVLKHKIPKRCGNYFLESHARISNNEKYIKEIRDFIQLRKRKKQEKYYNWKDKNK